MSDWAKSRKEIQKKDIEKMTEEASKFFGGILGDISTRSASTQIVLGALSGWATGYATMKIGKITAFAIGGTIIMLEIAHTQGIITIDWNKICRKLDNATERVETVVSGEPPRWIDKAERFVDRKLDRAEEILKREKKKAKKWYSKLIGDDNGPKINELHIFLTAFLGGVAIGIATA